MSNINVRQVTSIKQVLQGCLHDVCPHHLLYKLVLLCLLLRSVVLHLTRTGAVVIKQLCQGGIDRNGLHGWVHSLEERVGGAVLRVAIVGGAAPLQGDHGANIVGVNTGSCRQFRKIIISVRIIS